MPLLELERLSWWAAGAIFVAAAAAVVALGLWSLAGTSPARKWTAIGVRLLVVALLILVIGGARMVSPHKDLEVIVLNDASGSMQLVGDYPGRGKQGGPGTLQEALRRYYLELTRDANRKENDRLGIVSFRHNARVDELPATSPRGSVAPLAGEGGTDIAAGIRLALATFSPDAMKRLVLVSDGNNNLNPEDLEPAVDLARSQGVPIDVVPLRYDVQNDVMVERFVAPDWKRQNEAFNLLVTLRSTNAGPVTGTFQVVHIGAGVGSDAYLDVDPTQQGNARKFRKVTLQNGINTFEVPVPAQAAAGVHRFRAIFTPDAPGTGGVTASADSVDRNNSAEAFTIVRGRGQVLFVDGTFRAGMRGDPEGDKLFRTLDRELRGDPKSGADKDANPVARVGVEGFPATPEGLQGYYAVVLYNVSRGGAMTEGGNYGGMSPSQDRALKEYVQDMGGGLLMIGGPDTFGAGGWQGSEVEKILPVNMDVPAQRNVGKGALALIVHSCEMPEGNYWGQQCAIGAVKSLSSRDEVGVISYGWGGNANQNGIGGAQFDVPMSELRNREGVIDAVKRMKPGDMPSFDDAINLAVNGAGPNPRGLKHVKAKHRHIVIISDGDPSAPKAELLKQCDDFGISISTITVYPHERGTKKVPPVMQSMTERTTPEGKPNHGKAYGPIESDPQQLPQIFIKEAQIVKRTLIQEDLTGPGLPLAAIDAGDDLLRLIPGNYPAVRGMVLTTRKNDPKVVMPLASGPMKDPVLAYWQVGLGKAAVWTSDAHAMWASNWVGTNQYDTLFAGIVRKISRPPQSGDYDVRTVINGDKGELIVRAQDRTGESKNFLKIRAKILGGRDLKDGEAGELTLTQVAPGEYRASFDARTPNAETGSFIAVVAPEGESPIYGGAVKNGSLEDRDLRSNDALLRRVAEMTGGRELPPFDALGAEVFSRKGVAPGASPKPIWRDLLPWLLGLIILDVALRRIAWDWQSTKRAAVAAANRVRAFTATRTVESKETLEALRRKRGEVAETRLRPTTTAGSAGAAGGPPPVPSSGGVAAPSAPRPDPRAKFAAGDNAVEGDISQVVGGATNKPIPPPPKNVSPKGGPAGSGGHLGGLMAAKKRAQQQIKEKEQGEG